MKRPPRRARLQRKTVIQLTQPQRNFAAAGATYVGSPEHKLPHARSDATLCPVDLMDSQELLTKWLRLAIQGGWVGGLLEGDFPRYVWCQTEGRFFEGRLTNQALGHYKGYPIERSEAPQEPVGTDG